MKCPHCQVSFHENKGEDRITHDEYLLWVVEYCDCPTCNRAIIEAISYETVKMGQQAHKGKEVNRFFVYPQGNIRPNPPVEVPEKFAADYKEAALVLSDSPKASAALSRRCLQHLIREVAKIKARDLATEIQTLISSNAIPSHLSQALDAVRNIGNFAAHPIKSTSTGEIIDVEPGEAEWNLDVLDGLFDFYFVQPSLLQAKKAALNAKLTAAGKPTLN